ncbi:hypothetical protein [Mucilaginibacter gynuensis]
MKKLLIIPAIIGLLVTGVYAADKTKVADKEDEVSYAVLNQFNADFSDAKNVKWTVNSNCQKAEFVVDGVKKTAFYNLQGDFLGTTQAVEYKKVSARAQKEIANKYKGYVVSSVIEMSNDESTEHFVDLKNDKEELLVRVSPTSAVYFFKQVR